MQNHTISAVDGLLVGHASDETQHTGCTAVLCPDGAVGGIDVCGFSPGSRETALLDPTARIDEIHAVLLTGGSAFGLAAATGVTRYLFEQGYGLPTVFGKVPLVPAAVIYDLNLNQSFTKPDEAMGYEAARAASNDPVAQGCVGAGTGATCGKLGGFYRAMKTGLGSSFFQRDDLQVGAVVAANPVGAIVDPDTGNVLAGMRTQDGRSLAPLGESMDQVLSLIQPADGQNTVIAVVATNAKLDKAQTTRVARMGSIGIARAVRPAHMLFDGDTVFALATGKGPRVSDENIIGMLAADALAQAIVNAALHATSAPGYPAHRDL